MKKILVVLLCMLLFCAVPITAFAEDTVIDSVEAEGTVEEAPDTTAEPVPDSEASDKAQAITDYIVGFLEQNADTITLFVTVIVSIIYQARKHGLLNKSIGTLNNNAVTVAESSAESIQQAVVVMSGVSTAVTEFKETIAQIVDEYKQTAEDNKELREKLVEFEKYLKVAKAANVELSNEVAELIILANIPNSKKDELYARHRAAVALIAESETAEETSNEEGKEK